VLVPRRCFDILLPGNLREESRHSFPKVMKGDFMKGSRPSVTEVYEPSDLEDAWQRSRGHRHFHHQENKGEDR
jgi:hypothetical protein